MGKKCIPGLICIENMTLFVLMICVLFIIYLFYKISRSSLSEPPPPSSPPKATTIINVNGGGTTANGGPLYFDNGIEPQNVLAGISLATQPPLMQSPQAALVPINIETRPSSGTTYRQIGILSRTTGTEEILPIMGRKLSRDKWQYYTVSNSNMFLKLPIRSKGRDCTSEYGCDEIYSGDTVYVEGYGNEYKATIYENSRLHYLPYYY